MRALSSDERIMVVLEVVGDKKSMPMVQFVVKFFLAHHSLRNQY